MPGAAAAGTPSDRAALARQWLRGPLDLASVEYMPPGEDGAPGGGEFSTITSRPQAARAPIFRDLAPDVRHACGRVATMLDDALSLATGTVPPPPDF